LANGSYSVTPSNAGFTFSPVSQNVTVNGANVAGANFTAAVQVTHSVTLTWIASASTVTGYNVYRTTVSGTGYAKINSSLVVPVIYTDATVQNGTTYYYVTTAVDASGSGAYSRMKCRLSFRSHLRALFRWIPKLSSLMTGKPS